MNRILIAYASRYGATHSVAKAIGERLQHLGFSVDVLPMDERPDPAEYDGIVLGSSIRMGRWLTPALRFAETQASVLRQKPTAIFTVHMLNADETESSQAARAEYVAPLHALFTPQAEAFFTGEIDMNRLGMMDRFIARMVKAQSQDQRDWEAIQEWTDEVAQSVLAPNDK
jgi:menaquinone-dependent protoporphyrinogen oxidase